MKTLTFFLLLTGLFLAAKGNAQSENSMLVKIDSLEIDVFNNYESARPPIELNNLREPVLYTLNGEKLKITRFSELRTGEGAVESITIIRNPEELKEKGYSNYSSLVEVVTEKNEQKE